MALVHSLPIRNHSRHPQSMFIPRTNSHRVSSVYNGVRFTRIDRPQMGINFGGKFVSIEFKKEGGNKFPKWKWKRMVLVREEIFLEYSFTLTGPRREKGIWQNYLICNWALTVYETGVRIEENIPDNKTANKISAKNSNFCNVWKTIFYN